jgi:VWFA-related protein
MRPKGRSRSSWLLLGLALAGSSGAEQPAVFSGSTEVVSVDVPIQVTVSGEPARSLTAADFAVYEGRKRLKIAGFETIDLAAAGAAERAVPAAARRYFLLLVDLSHSDPKAVTRALAASRSLLEILHSSDLVAVATYRLTAGPQLILGFTSDRRQIEAALETLGLPQLFDRAPDPLRLSLGSLRRDVNTVAVTTNIGLADPFQRAADAAPAVAEFLAAAAIDSARSDRSVQKVQVEDFVRSLSTFGRLLSDVDGRKYVVLLSEGYDSSLLTGTVDAEKEAEMQEQAMSGEGWRIDSEARFGSTEAGNDVERMLEELRRADCVVQAVDIGGLRAEAEQGFQRRGGRESLLQLARGTGGELFESFNDLTAALNRMWQRTSFTYLLTVEPEKLVADGSYHRLRIELKAPLRGAQVSARQGFYAPKPYAEQDPLEKLLQTANQVMSGEERNDVDLSVLAVPVRTEGEKSYVSLQVEAGGESLLRGAQPPKLPVEVYIYALDGGGAVHDFVTETLGFDLAKAATVLRQGGLKFAAHLELLPGDFSLRVLVRNGATGLFGLKVVPLRVAEGGERTTVLLPPLFPDPPNRWLLAREEPRGEMREPPLPYTPAARPELVPGQPARFVAAGYGLGKGPWKGEADLLAAGGLKLASGRLQISQPVVGAAGPDRAVATLIPPELPPGLYTLRLTVVGAGEKGATSSIRVAVRPARHGAG